jgi:hypothetical protein
MKIIGTTAYLLELHSPQRTVEEVVKPGKMVFPSQCRTATRTWRHLFSPLFILTGKDVGNTPSERYVSGLLL